MKIQKIRTTTKKENTDLWTEDKRIITKTEKKKLFGFLKRELRLFINSIEEEELTVDKADSIKSRLSGLGYYSEY